MNVLSFRFEAKFGHFLRAEANANGITYPVPPRTVLLGLLGCVLGLEKDQPQQTLADAPLAIAGAMPKRFWHRTNIRKDPPTPLPYRVTAKTKGSGGKPEKTFRFPQEWLWMPRYRVWASLPEAQHAELANRLRDRRWHFTPCMGLSEMLANLEPLGEYDAEPLSEGTHRIATIAPQEAGQVDTAQACEEQLALQSLRMPYAVTADRVFSHKAYFVEHQGRPFPIRTAHAWQCGEEKVVFL